MRTATSAPPARSTRTAVLHGRAATAPAATPLRRVASKTAKNACLVLVVNSSGGVSSCFSSRGALFRLKKLNMLLRLHFALYFLFDAERGNPERAFRLSGEMRDFGIGHFRGETIFKKLFFLIA